MDRKNKSFGNGKTFLIVGGGGFIGSNFAIECIERGATVRVLDNFNSRGGGNLYNLDAIKGDFELIRDDVLYFEDWESLLNGVDCVLNCASSTSHPLSMREPLFDLENNCRLVLILLAAIKKYRPVAKVINLGTTTQLGKLLSAPADELHAEFPLDIYSANKVASEKYVLVYANNFGISGINLRLSNVFGPRAPIHSSEFTFNNYFVGCAIKDGLIKVFGEGESLRNVLYVDDAVQGIFDAFQNLDRMKGAYFLVGDNHYSVKDIAKTTGKVFDANVLHVEYPAKRKVFEIGNAVYRNNKFKKITGWGAKIGLEEGLLAMKEFLRNSKEQYLR